MAMPMYAIALTPMLPKFKAHNTANVTLEV